MSVAFPVFLAAFIAIPSQFKPNLRAQCSMNSIIFSGPPSEACMQFISEFAEALEVGDDVMNIYGLREKLQAASAELSGFFRVLADSRTRNTRQMSNPAVQVVREVLDELGIPATGQSDYVMEAVSKSAELGWPFWHQLVFKAGNHELTQNMQNLLRARSRSNLVESVQTECVHFHERMADLFLDGEKAIVAQLCSTRMNLTLYQVVQGLRGMDLAKYDHKADGDAKHAFIRNYFETLFYSESQYNQLLKYRRIVERIPMELMFMEKIECIGRDELFSCIQAVKKLQKNYPISAQAGLTLEGKLEESRLQQLEQFGMRMRVLLASREKEGFVAALESLVYASNTLLIQAPLLAVHHVKQSRLDDILAEYEQVKPILTFFNFLVKYAQWPFRSLVATASHETQFRSAILREFKNALFARHRKIIYDQYLVVCNQHQTERLLLSPGVIGRLARTCAFPTVDKIINALPDSTLERLDSLAVKKDITAIYDTLMELMAMYFSKVASHAVPVTASSWAEVAEDDRSCEICSQFMEDSDLCLRTCDEKHLVCRPCLQNWINSRPNCPFCSSALGALPAPL